MVGLGHSLSLWTGVSYTDKESKQVPLIQVKSERQKNFLKKNVQVLLVCGRPNTNFPPSFVDTFFKNLGFRGYFIPILSVIGEVFLRGEMTDRSHLSF